MYKYSTYAEYPHELGGLSSLQDLLGLDLSVEPDFPTAGL